MWVESDAIEKRGTWTGRIIKMLGEGQARREDIAARVGRREDHPGVAHLLCKLEEAGEAEHLARGSWMLASGELKPAQVEPNVLRADPTAGPGLTH